MKIIFITNCSVTRNFTPLIRVQDVPAGTMQECLDWWVANLRKLAKDPEILQTPGDIYAGMAYDTITEIAQKVGHKNVHIVTGGQGLISLDQPIVPYDFTSDKSALHNIVQKVQGEKFVPNVWWHLINESMTGSSTPVADLLRQHEDSILVGALTKGFLKYIEKDLATLTEEVLKTRVFIPIPRASTTSYVQQVRAGLVPYGKSFTEGLSSNRYNKPHVVAQKLIQVFKNSKKAPWEVAESISSQARSEAAESVLRGTDANTDYEEMFEEHPDLLKCDTPEQAIKLAKVLGLNYGGKHKFTAAWRGERGRFEMPEVSEELQSKGIAALDRLVQTSEVDSGNSELLDRCGMFVELMRTRYPGHSFTSGMAAEWGSETFGESDTSGITSAAKLSYVFEYNAKYLGLEISRDSGKLIFTPAQKS